MDMYHKATFFHASFIYANYHIAGNIRGRKLLQIGKNEDFAKKSFVEQSTNLHGCGYWHSTFILIVTSTTADQENDRKWACKWVPTRSRWSCVATTCTRLFEKLQLDKCWCAFSEVKLSYVPRLDVGVWVSLGVFSPRLLQLQYLKKEQLSKRDHQALVVVWKYLSKDIEGEMSTLSTYAP